MKQKVILIFLTIIFISCKKDSDELTDRKDMDYKQKMRELVIGISQYAKSKNPDFNIVPQNGIELVTDNGDESGTAHKEYLNAIDGNGQEDLFYGYDDDDQKSPAASTNYLKPFLNISKKAGKTILVTDYCSTTSKVTDSYSQNANMGYISFAANQRELNVIPKFPKPIQNENSSVVTKFAQVKNFLYLINPSGFAQKSDFINTVVKTNYDLLIMDLYFTDGSMFTAEEINQLKSKANGGKRLIISYMSIGEAEDYRYYWNSSWKNNPPSWLDKENPSWEGNFKVKYWDPNWQQIIYGNDSSYLKKIVDAKFDGVYLDIIDAFEYYEK